MKQQTRRQPASFTVEAALIFPIVFFIVCGLIDVSFFLRDRALAEAAVSRASARAVMQQKYAIDYTSQQADFTKIEQENIADRTIGRTKETQEATKEYLNDQLEAVTFASITEEEVLVTQWKVTVRVHVKFHSVFFSAIDTLADDLFTTDISKEQSIYNPVEVTRIAAALYETAEGIQGAETIMDKIGKMISLIR